MEDLVKHDADVDLNRLVKFRKDRRFPFAIEARELKKCETFAVTEVKFRQVCSMIQK